MRSTFKIAIVWIAQILVGLLFVLVSLPKLQGNPGVVEQFHGWGFPAAKQMAFLTGVLEFVGGAGFLIPITARYGGVLLIVVMTGAFLTHVLNGEWPRLIIITVLGGIILFVIINRRNSALAKGDPSAQTLATSETVARSAE